MEIHGNRPLSELLNLALIQMNGTPLYHLKMTANEKIQLLNYLSKEKFKMKKWEGK